jgi:hypothetical protein
MKKQRGKSNFKGIMKKVSGTKNANRVVLRRGQPTNAEGCLMPCVQNAVLNNNKGQLCI